MRWWLAAGVLGLGACETRAVVVQGLAAAGGAGGSGSGATGGSSGAPTAGAAGSDAGAGAGGQAQGGTTSGAGGLSVAGGTGGAAGSAGAPGGGAGGQDGGPEAGVVVPAPVEDFGCDVAEGNRCPAGTWEWWCSGTPEGCSRVDAEEWCCPAACEWAPGGEDVLCPDGGVVAACSAGTLPPGCVASHVTGPACCGL